ncbi:hypothetical protein Oweho_3292 [Owenweeksia hongkongensis DSM 17368]|uniref:Uncharacterized protein n=1 Tax=Owenweeksia hongkongensis (strain DSM 17368 / CIP 108786 / JCM 12287 / NRRL B-23963 / UST20020801) TaxID=926562 RepID=G8R4E3_OWEHD|nr:T9SS C-terminal target domain-containing protein [Owenweeksia hongkongensis]AEV34243.1 hypothetical protein Oweho_3292 [Owenweeksia hongkongensis DSM 17368]
MKRIETSSKQILLTIVTLFLSTVTFASHIVGGEMSYKCLGNDYYQITLRYYRDCGGVVMPPSTDIEIANPSGTIIQTHNVPKGPSSFLNVNQPGCGQPTPAICIETAEYVVDSAYLPGGLASYTIYNQECCRNNNVDNIANAWKTGATFPAYLYPSSTLGCNSSPTFGAYPPVAIPVNVPLSVPINASDVDGDSLFFQLCSPLNDATPSSPFSSVSFAPGYSSNNMVPSSPAFSIDPATGILSGTPNQLGKFAIGICVNEYRNGVLIGKVRRDYQFTVITPWSLFGTITAQTDAGCGSGGSATVTAAGASGPYTYNWSNNATTATANNLSVGTHTVIVSNGSCSDTASVVIKGGASFTTNVTNQTTLACGATTGASATISINGGVPPYNVVWPSGPGGLTNNQLNLGANKVAVTDNANCTDTVTIMITQGGAGVTVSVDSIKATSCATAANGYVSLLGNGGAAPYTFTWSDSTTASTRTNLLPGNYGVKVTDANGCSDSVSISVPAGAGLTLSWDSIQSISCPGGSNGYLKPLVSGGAAPYSFLWNTNASTSALGGLSSGTYILTVTDVFGCVESIAHDFLDPDSLTLSLNHIEDPSCHNAFDGAIHVGISGGTAPYNILWNTSNTSSTLNNLPSGNYSVTVTDSRGCSLSANYMLANPDSLWLSFKTIQTISCNGGIDAAVEVEVNGGSTPYVYSWSNSVQSALNNNLSAGTYSVSVTDSAGCIASAQYIVTEPSALSIHLDSVEVASCGLPNGAASITVTGGTAPYAVVWSNSMMGSSIAGVASGNYTAVVTDALGCQDSLQVFVPSTSNVALRVDSVFQPSCGVPNGYVGVSVGGGVAPYSYTWSNGGSSTSSSGLSSGTYTIIVKDSKDCEDSVSVNLVATTTPSISFQTTKDPTCNGNNGELSIAILGGQAPYTVLWNTNDTSRALSNLAAGTYGVTVTDGNGCMVASQYTLVTPTPLVLNLDTLAAATCGNQNGMASISVSGGTAPYYVTWSNSQQGSQISGLAAGTYTAYVTDSIGCIDSISVEVQNLSGFSASLDTTVLPSCFGGSDGFAKVLPQGGQAPYTFIWSNGSTSDTAMGLAAGNYHVIVQDAIGCGDSINFLLYSPNQLQVAVDTIQNPSCFGGNDGILSIDISGGNAPYNILWSTSDTVSTLNNLGSGSYGVTVTDSRGCSTTASFTLSNPDSLQIVLKNQQNVSCHGGNDGAIDVSVKGGTAPYSLLWNNSQVDSSLANLTTGTYTLVLTDANGCSSQASFIITEPQALSVVVDSVSSETCGQQNGRASISVNGGTAPYSILWNTKQSAPSIQGLSAGTYNAVVTDANGCSDSVQVMVQGATNVALSLDSVFQPSCGAPNGYIEVSVGGGVAPYSYTWSNGGITASSSGLGAGNYLIRVQDANGCEDSVMVNLASATAPALAFQTTTHPTCGGADGELSIAISGGQAPYTILWNTNDTSRALSNLAAGTYGVTVTDGNGCMVASQYTLVTPTPLVLNLDTLAAATCGNQNGMASVSVSGGTAPYSVTWSNSQLGSQITGLAAGTYTAYVSDSIGCTDSISVQVQNLSGFSASLDTTVLPSCFGGSDGFAKVLPQGGNAPYTFTWSNGSISDTTMGLAAGNYYVIVQDAIGCEDSINFLLTSPAPLQVSSDSLQNPSCFGGNDGILSIDISGGNAPYNILWSTSDTVSTLNNLGSGSYGVTVTDSRGCSTTASFTLSNPDSLQIVLKNQQSVSCHGGNDGAIDVSVKGGTAPYSLLWNNSQVDSSLANLTAGTYTLVLTDANGCSSQASFIITEPQALSVVVDSVSSETCGQQNGTASISVSGGTAPYSILWNTNQVTPSVQGLSAGTYNAVVTDANGCSDSVQVSVAGGGNFSLSLDSSSAPLCAGTNTGFAKVDITGGTAPFSYNWSNGSTSDTAHGLSGGFNYVLVSDALGCNDSLAVNLSSPDSLEIELQSIDHALCNGLSGSISINVKGGEAPYSINWSNNVSGQTLLNVKPGIYSVNVTDGKGCSATATYTITEPDSFIVVVDSIKHPTCAGEGDGEVFLRASGNTGISSIVVNHGKVTSAGVTDLHAGKYSVYVLDSAGCGTSVAFEIKDPQPLVVEDVNVIAPGCDPTDFGFIELAVSGGLAPYTYKWQDGTTTLNHYNVDNGSYRLVVTDAGGCSTTRTFEFMNKDMRLFVSMEELTCASYADAEIQIAVSGAVAPFHLSLNGQEVYEGKMNLQSANYVLSLTDAEGCIVTEEFVISEQVEVKAFFATAFTPDGDGINDTYTIKGSEECFTNATMEVFNRWGAKVFETNQPFKEAWDGTVNGYIAKSDVYLYSFKSDQLTETGHFNILR